MVSTQVASALASSRERCNARFVAARRSGAAIDGGAVLAAIEQQVAPVVDACEAAVTGSAAAVLDDLYDLVLVLVPQGLLGSAPRRPEVAAAWTGLLPALARFVAADPRRVAGSVTNAVHTLADRGGRPADWIALVRAAAQACDDVESLLRAGQVAGWRSGLPQHRLGALELAAALPPSVAAAALGVPAVDGGVLAALRAHPWADPLHPRPVADRVPTIVARVGSFRGFGGPFLRPPVVSAAGDRIVATDGEAVWSIAADSFGAALLRDDEAHGPPVAGDLSPDDVDLPEVRTASSWAAVGPTLAATSARSHHITLVARR